jgi:hypothetical protein
MPIPISSQTVDYLSTVTKSIDALVTSGAPVFITAGNQLLTALAIIMLVIYGLKWGAASASGHHANFDVPGAIHFLALFLIAEAMMRYYDVPLPWTSSSVRTILPDTGRQFAAAIDITILNTFNDHIKTALASIEKPGLDMLMVPVYLSTLGFMACMQGILFAVTILGFIAVGIGSMLGPLFIPWLMVPRLSWLFWNWVTFMLEYSFYRIIASAIIYIWSNVIVTFIDQSVHGDYSLGHFTLLLAPLLMLSIGMLYTVFRITSFVHDLFKGASSAGAGLGLGVAAAIRGAFA